MCVFNKNMFGTPRLWLIKKKSIKSHIEDGERVYDLPIMLLDRVDRQPENWDIYASRQFVNYVGGKNIYKLTQPYSKRQYDKIKKASYTVFDSEGNEYYMFEATAFPKYHIVKNDKAKQQMIKRDIDNGILPGNYMTSEEYDKECFHKGFKGDPPIVVNIRDFDHECYPDNLPMVYVKSERGRQSSSADAYIRVPRENKLTLDDVIKHNQGRRCWAKDSYYIAKFGGNPSQPNDVTYEPIWRHKAKLSSYTLQSSSSYYNMDELPEKITELMRSIRPLHLKYIEQRRDLHDPNYIPKEIYSKDNIAEDSLKQKDDPFSDWTF